MSQTAFVTGASGFIGRHLVDRLLDDGWQVKALIHKKGFPRDNECEIVNGDIEDFTRLHHALEGVDVLFHLASALGGSLLKTEEFFRINAYGTVTVLEAAHAAGVPRVVHFSSAGVLGHVEENEPADEKHPIFPIDPYDNSKLLGENSALEFSDKGMEVVVIRPGWVYGPEDRRTFKLVKAIAGGWFFLVSKGTTKQTPVYIDDLIQGTLLSVKKGKTGQIYHIAGEEALSVQDIAMVIGDSCGKKIHSLHIPLWVAQSTAFLCGGLFRLFGKEAPLTKGRLAFFTHPKPLAKEKARKGLGYAPRYSFAKGMERAVSWYRENKWLKK